MYKTPLCTKRSIIIARMHYSVPSRASSSHDCTTSYQAEQSHRKIALLRTKRNNLTARLHYSVPLGSILQRSTFVPLVDVAAMFGCCTTPYQAEQESSQYPISIDKRAAPNDAGPFPLQRVINLKFSHSFVVALHRCSVADKKSLFYGSKIVLYLYIYKYKFKF